MRKLLLIFTLICLPLLAQGAASSPVTVNSISCTSGTCTVTTAAVHNIPANNPGLTLQGGPAGDIGGFTAATVPTTTTFTVVSSTMVTCASSCGTAQPAKNFLILGDPLTNNLGFQTVTVCVWNYNQTPLSAPNFVSACSLAEPSAPLLSAENGALASGAWTETFIVLTFASSDTRAQIEQEIQRMQFARQTAISAGIQPGRDTGTFCDAVGCNQ
jgi:hypothetical protein